MQASPHILPAETEDAPLPLRALDTRVARRRCGPLLLPPACATPSHWCVECCFGPTEVGRLRGVRRSFAMDGALCEPLATRFVADDVDEVRRRGSRQLPRRRSRR